jgi:hypothetical protein
MRSRFFPGWLLGTGVALAAACGGASMLETGGTSTSSAGGTGSAGGGLAHGQCRAMSDCKDSTFTEVCLQPGAFLCGGPCDPMPPPTCAGDADCAAEGAAAICTVPPCACPKQPTCTQGCASDATCGAGETCGPTHRCAPTACVSASDCPVNFACAEAACHRIVCTDDAPCNGYCVDGLCFDTPGTCSMLVN